MSARYDPLGGGVTGARPGSKAKERTSPGFRAWRRTPAVNFFFYGDNLHILREYVEDGSVDLVYLDPPIQLERHLGDPTVTMRREASAAGFYESPLHGDVPKRQIITIEEPLRRQEASHAVGQPERLQEDEARGSETQGELGV
jgi:hypothetical protein